MSETMPLPEIHFKPQGRNREQMHTVMIDELKELKTVKDLAKSYLERKGWKFDVPCPDCLERGATDPHRLTVDPEGKLRETAPRLDASITDCLYFADSEFSTSTELRRIGEVFYFTGENDGRSHRGRGASYNEAIIEALLAKLDASLPVN